jgi:hypothetical protein
VARRLGAVASALAALGSCALFFGNYALDDSFVGYANAQNLARGLGFAFNPGERLLTTSAPLVVPFYAAGATLGIDIVTLGQIVSALALVASALLAYRIALRIAPAFGAFSAAFVLVTSPFVVLLWSHESLVWLALALGAIELSLERRFVGGALVLGLSGLARPEAIFVAPFLLGWVYRAAGRRATVRYALFAAIPFLLWAAFALPVFGTVFSQSIAAKHAQMLYGGVPYASGLVAHYIYLYANTTSEVAAAFLLLALALTSAAALRTPATREATASLVIWFALLSAFYIVAQVHFFVWFGIQAAVVTAFLAGAAWAAPASLLGRLGKLGALCILAVNALFIASLARDAGSKYSLDGMLVLPHVEHNNYYRLAQFARAHTQPSDTLAYPEIGQLRYYGERTIVDFDGLATPGVARAMERGDTIWAFERYRPTVFIDAERHWANIVDPPEYDWFARAYVRGETLVLPPEPGKDHFTFYRLVNAAAVPPPDVLERDADVETGADGLSFRASPSGETAALEVRLDARRCSNGRIVVAPARGPATTVPIVATPFRHTVRVRVALDRSAEPPFDGRIEGCAAGALAPPLLPRFGFLLFEKPRVRGSPADAIRLFAPAPA